MHSITEAVEIYSVPTMTRPCVILILLLFVANVAAQQARERSFFVVAAADEFKLLHTAGMGDEGDDKLRSTIVPSQGNLFIRTGSKLYCIGK